MVQTVLTVDQSSDNDPDLSVIIRTHSIQVCCKRIQNEVKYNYFAEDCLIYLLLSSDDFTFHRNFKTQTKASGSLTYLVLDQIRQLKSIFY